MAKKLITDKGFLTLLTSKSENFKMGGSGICDECNCTPLNGVYVAALNHWMCFSCFEEWHNIAVRFESDIPIEERNYKYYSSILL